MKLYRTILNPIHIKPLWSYKDDDGYIVALIQYKTNVWGLV